MKKQTFKPAKTASGLAGKAAGLYAQAYAPPSATNIGPQPPKPKKMKPRK